MDKISLSDALKQMESCRHLKSDETFSIVFLKCDRRRKQGGDWRRIERAQLAGLPYSVKDNEMRGLVDTDSGLKVAFHVQLVFEFNGKSVYK